MFVEGMYISEIFLATVLSAFLDFANFEPSILDSLLGPFFFLSIKALAIANMLFLHDYEFALFIVDSWQIFVELDM